MQDEKSYNKLFTILKEHGAFEEGVSPRRSMADFEMALQNAISTNLPWAEVQYSKFM